MDERADLELARAGAVGADVRLHRVELGGGDRPGEPHRQPLRERAAAPGEHRDAAGDRARARARDRVEARHRLGDRAVRGRERPLEARCLDGRGAGQDRLRRVHGPRQVELVAHARGLYRRACARPGASGMG
jgi:hypothetical protein